MKELTSREIAAVKRQFKNSLPALQKIQAINKKIVELVKEKAIQEAILEGGETGIKALTGGYKSTDLITCTYEPQFNEDGTPKMDKDGKYQQKKQVLTFHEPEEPEEETIEGVTQWSDAKAYASDNEGTDQLIMNGSSVCAEDTQE